MTFCPVCGDVALDGHITCGRWQCNEGEQRRNRADAYAEARRVQQQVKREDES